MPPVTTVLSERQRRRFSGRGLYRRLRRATSWDGEVHLRVTFDAEPSEAQHAALYELDLACKTCTLLGDEPGWTWSGRTRCGWHHMHRDDWPGWRIRQRREYVRLITALVRAPGPSLIVRSDRGNKLAWS